MKSKTNCNTFFYNNYDDRRVWIKYKRMQIHRLRLVQNTETTDEASSDETDTEETVPIPARLQMKQQIRSRKLQIREMEIMKTILR